MKPFHPRDSVYEIFSISLKLCINTTNWYWIGPWTKWYLNILDLGVLLCFAYCFSLIQMQWWELWCDESTTNPWWGPLWFDWCEGEDIGIHSCWKTQRKFTRLVGFPSFRGLDGLNKFMLSYFLMSLWMAYVYYISFSGLDDLNKFMLSYFLVSLWMAYVCIIYIYIYRMWYFEFIFNIEH